MGVKECNRNGCEAILCDHYSSDYGYICSSCLAELSGSYSRDIQRFMDSPKEGAVPYDQNYWENYVYELFSTD